MHKAKFTQAGTAGYPLASPPEGYLVWCPEGCNLGTSRNQPDLAAAERRVHLHELATTTFVEREEQRRELCEAEVTLDGRRARVIGYANPFATVATLPDGPRVEFAWSTVARIIERGGEFRSF